MTTDEQRDQLFGQFQETDEMQDWDQFVQQVRRALEKNPSAETLTVPAAFLRRVIEEIGATPTLFAVYRERFNQLCDEMGMAEEKEKE